MRTSELIARGHSAHRLKRACAAGALIRPARGWIALPGTDSELIAAARAGMLLTCVSLAQRRGLWVRGSARLHLATRSSHAHVRGGAHTAHTVHWGLPVRRREPFAVEDSIENALNYVATCQPPEEALAIWESALHGGIVSRSALRRFPYRGAARELLEHCTPFSASGLETYVLRRIRLLRLHIVPQAVINGHRVDYLIERCVILEIDGATHTGEQRDRDNRNDVIEALEGYLVIRVSYRQVLDDWPEVQRRIMDAVSQMHGARPGHETAARVRRNGGRP